jgi:hypothetical protein
MYLIFLYNFLTFFALKDIQGVFLKQMRRNAHINNVRYFGPTDFA